MKKEVEKIESEKIFVEGVKSVVEGEEVYRRSDGKKMMVIGIVCSFLDQYGSRKAE